MAAVLLVDGDRNFRQALAIALRLDGHDVSTAESVEQARSVLERGPVTCCVVDCLVPGADAFLSGLPRLGCRRVVATSTYAEMLDSAAQRHPGVALLQKPFAAAELVRELAAA